jgi:exodeoxyribonuclease-3
LISLNLNGIRSAAKKGLEAWVERERPNCMCVQELKAQADDMQGGLDHLAGLKGYFQHALQKGYSGVGIFTRHEPSDIRLGTANPEFDAEGRCLELRFDTPARKLSLVSAYFPSGSSGPERQDAKFRFLKHIFSHLIDLRQGSNRAVVVCGDVNIAHQPLDLKNWKGNLKNSGFLPEERAWMTRLLQSGYVDVYRQLYPDHGDQAYTWWSNRGQAWANNVGWRIDYQLATPELAQQARQATVFKDERFSDHAPLTVLYDTAL